MEYHYKAFISYRHSERDSRVAAEVQNRLERYSIPASIKRSTGVKNIGRIFRDKDELSSTNDLNDTIKDALNSSEYLICICSHDYMESIWCQKEIDFFLETHDKAHVLTVLSEGDPYEVMPGILCRETIVTTDENGNEVTVEVPLEPLSCDYRMERSRARSEELPRLAAVLIGCRYAELRQKLRRRKIRLLTLAAVAAVILVSYFIWSYLNIQRNLKQSLINQSRYLASSAQEALDENNNMLAAQLSLAALPQKGNDRPLVPQAVYTLSRALGAYQSKDILNFRGASVYSTPGGSIYEFLVTDDAKYLILNEGNISLTIYDLLADRRIGDFRAEDLLASSYFTSITLCGKDKLLVHSSSTVALMNLSDGSVIWKQTYNNYISACAFSEKTGLVLLSSEKVRFVDAVSSDITARLDVRAASEDAADRFFMISSGLNYGKTWEIGDNGKLYIMASLKEDPLGIVTFDPGTGETVWTPFDREMYNIEGLSPDLNGGILVTYAETEEEYRISNGFGGGSYNSSAGSFDVGRTRLCMLREGTGEVLWEQEFTYTGVRQSERFFQDIREVPVSEGSEKTRRVSVSAVSNAVFVADAGTGEALQDIRFSDNILYLEPQDPEENFIRVEGSDGKSYTIEMPEDDLAYSGISFMTGSVDDVRFVHARNSCTGLSEFIVRQGGMVHVFKAEQGDDGWQAFSEKEMQDVTSGTLIGSRYLYESNGIMTAIDLDSGKILWKSKLKEEYYHRYKGTSSDGETYYYLSSEDSYSVLLCINASDGKWEKISLTENDVLSGTKNWSFEFSSMIAAGNSLFYSAQTKTLYPADYWFRFDMDDRTLHAYRMPYRSEGYVNSSIHLFSSDGKKAVLFYNGAGYRVDFETGEVIPYDTAFPEITSSSYSDADGKFVLYTSDEKAMRVYSSSGTELYRIDTGSETVQSMDFYGSDLIVSMKDGLLFRYDSQTGQEKGRTETPTYLYNRQSKFYEPAEGELLIISGSYLYIIDLDSWDMLGYAVSILGYCEENRRIISAANKKILGYCNYYTVDDLIEKGRHFVEDNEMTERQKYTYGIG